MLYVYIYVRGEEQLKKMLGKMGKEMPRFVESFAHAGEITVERIYEKPSADDWFREYFILYMKHRNGTMHIDEIRSKVHQDIRAGEKGIRKV